MISPVSDLEEHCAAVGRAAHQRGLHWYRPDHGLGQQGKQVGRQAVPVSRDQKIILKNRGLK